MGSPKTFSYVKTAIEEGGWKSKKMTESGRAAQLVAALRAMSSSENNC